MEGLRDRGIGEEAISDLKGAAWAAAEGYMREYDLPDDVTFFALIDSMTIGACEVVAESLDTDAIDEEGVEDLADAILQNPVEEMQVVVGRMLDRDRGMQAIVAEFHRNGER